MIKIDVDQEELGEVVGNHQVQGIPLLAFYNKDGKLVHKKVGYADDAAFQALEKTYLVW